MATKLSDEEKRLLKQIVDHFENEDRDVRDRQIRLWKRLKLMWDGFHRIWYSEVAHDWRVWDEVQDYDTSNQEYYDKPINVFRAYLETIIAALSTTIPPIKCYPDDADSPLDIATANAGDKIADLVQKHNDASMIWLQALYVYCTEGMVAAYNYTDEDEKYGTYEEDKYEDVQEEIETLNCPECGAVINPDEYDPSIETSEQLMNEVPEELMAMNDMISCPSCGNSIDPITGKEEITVTRLVGKIKKPKARQCIEVYGGLYIKVPNYAKKQSDIPYLLYSYETNYALARHHYPDIRDKIHPGQGNPAEPYARWGRNNPQYQGEYPIDTVTIRNCWLRPSAFEILEDEDECNLLKKRFPNGAKVVFVEEECAEARDESLDDHWTLTYNPLADYLVHDPIGLLLTSIQEITNDLVSLTVQTIEHGIPQTFADPNVLNFDQYRQMETIPGGVYPATAKSGRSVGDGFYDVRTSTLSQEVIPFINMVQSFGQVTSGALPSLFGGQLEGSETASQYSMSRAQALQRLQSTWKMFTVWWKQIFGKVIPAYIKTMKSDERVVQKNELGGFVNILIRKAELEGKIGSIELESNENLPMSWNQRRDMVMKLLEANNPQILQLIAHPENLPLIYEAIGITDFYVPGEDDRNKQYNEIRQLVISEPIIQSVTPEEEFAAVEAGMLPPEPMEMPSVEVNPEIDNHIIEFEICRKWLISEEGQIAKIENEAGYRNVLLHALQHKQFMMQSMIPNETGAAPLENPTENTEAPIQGEANVGTTQ